MQSEPPDRPLLTSSRFQWTRNPACRPLAIPRPTFRPFPASIPKSVAITNTRDSAPVPYWRRWTFRTAMSRRALRTVTAALSSLAYCPISTGSTRLNAPSESYSDNHSAHISRETQAFLSKHPNRFQYVLTPKHGSWLNIVETLFGKMARSFLRHIRVQSLGELKARIRKGIEEINAAPVVHRWKNFDALAQD